MSPDGSIRWRRLPVSVQSTGLRPPSNPPLTKRTLTTASCHFFATVCWRPDVLRLRGEGRPHTATRAPKMIAYLNQLHSADGIALPPGLRSTKNVRNPRRTWIRRRWPGGAISSSYSAALRLRTVTLDRKDHFASAMWARAPTPSLPVDEHALFSSLYDRAHGPSRRSRTRTRFRI